MAGEPHTLKMASRGMAALPIAFTVMLRPKGTAGYAVAGRCVLATMPSRGQLISASHEGRLIRGTIDELFIPPGCEEHCIGTVFVSEA